MSVATTLLFCQMISTLAACSVQGDGASVSTSGETCQEVLAKKEVEGEKEEPRHYTTYWPLCVLVYSPCSCYSI